MIEDVLAFGQQVRHGMARCHVGQEPQGMREIGEQRRMAEGQHRFLRAHLELVGGGLGQRAADQIEPLLHVVLVFELRFGALADSGEEHVEIELVELSRAGHAGDGVGHLVGHEDHAGEGRIGVGLEWVRARPLLLGLLLVGVRPVEDLVLDELAAGQRAEGRAG